MGPSSISASASRLAATSAILAFGVGYPWLVSAALECFGLRPVAAAGAVLALAALALQVATLRRPHPVATAVQLGGLVALGAAALADDRTPLLLVPALVQAGLCAVFARSLAEPVCIVHRAARIMQPLVPDWIGPYCRGVTLAWSAFFAANALAIALLAVAGSLAWWTKWTGAGLWAASGAGMALEFVVRKSLFRYYPGGAVDRLWSALLPAENTARGRRSMEYIRLMRSRMSS